MFMRFLDHLEEILISLLMACAVIIIFYAVCNRLALGYSADLISWARRNDHPEVMGYARSTYMFLTRTNPTWAQELCIYLFVWMAKFGAAYGARIGIHVGVDVLVERVSANWQKILTTIALLACILFTAIVTVIGYNFVVHIYHTGQVSADLEVKMWIVYLAVPAGSFLMCFRFVQALWIYIRTGELAHHDHAGVEGIEEEALEGGRT